jgi:hypothetical protein
VIATVGAVLEEAFVEKVYVDEVKELNEFSPTSLK